MSTSCGNCRARLDVSASGPGRGSPRVHAALARIGDPRIRLLVEILIHTGLRIGDATRLALDCLGESAILTRLDEAVRWMMVQLMSVPFSMTWTIDD